MTKTTQGENVMASQELKLLARIAENLPEMDSDIRQGWIENPKALKQALTDALCPPKDKVDSSNFQVVSDGTTGEEWIKRLSDAEHKLSNYAKQVLRSKDFVPTNGVTYDISIIKGTEFSNAERITEKIREEARNRGLETPHPEIACLLREKFSNNDLKEVGLFRLVVFHKPINDAEGDPSLLGLPRFDGNSWLRANGAYPGNRWHHDVGFVFLRPQVQNFTLGH